LVIKWRRRNQRCAVDGGFYGGGKSTGTITGLYCACDYTGNSPYQQAELGQQLSVQWYNWLLRRVSDNTAYDEIAAGIILATGRGAGQDYDDYAAEMSAFFRDESPAEFASREHLPHFWTRRNVAKPEDKALAFAHSFLGVRLACAQCHKHPYDQWSQQDFQQFTQFFTRIKRGVAPDAAESQRQLKTKLGVPVKLDTAALRRQMYLRVAAEGSLPLKAGAGIV